MLEWMSHTLASCRGPPAGERQDHRAVLQKQVQSAYALRLRGKEKLLRVCYPMFDIYK